MKLVNIVVTMHNTKKSFLKMLKIYLQLRNALKKFLSIKSIVVLNMETKKMVKNGLGKTLAKLYLLTGKIYEDSLFDLFFPVSLNKLNKDKFMNHLRFKNLFKVVMITYSTIK